MTRPKTWTGTSEDVDEKSSDQNKTEAKQPAKAASKTDKTGD